MSSGGRLVVISGPSGVGKSAICAELLTLSSFRRVITCTTRSPRDGEVDGRDYHFLSEEAFDAKVERGEFLEHAEVHGRRYGTLRAPVEASMADGHYVLLAIDVQGARELRRQAGAATRGRQAGAWTRDLVTIFLVPPDRQTLIDRLRRRGTEAEAELSGRLRAAEDEMAAKDEFDEVIVNDDLDRAVADILKCLRAPEGLHREFANRVR